MNIEKLNKIIPMLTCPVCKKDNPTENPDVELKNEEIVCTVCGSRYPINEGEIPCMLEDSAKMPEEK